MAITRENKINCLLYKHTRLNISILLNPIIPNATNKVLDTMNIDITNRKINEIKNMNCFDHNRELKSLDILFKKIDNDS